MSAENSTPEVGAQISVLNAGKCPSYALGLTKSLAASGVNLDFIGGDDEESSGFSNFARIRFLNLRGNQRTDAGVFEKVKRVLVYYFRLVGYAATARSKIFHILWNNKFEWFDRTALMLFYKLLGKKIAFTAHNINAAKRDGHDSFLNRSTLKIQYRLSDHIFVHTAKMKNELISDFGVREEKTSVVPHGINCAVPKTALTGMEARRHLGVGERDQVILFFGYIAPYKGLEFLVEAFTEMAEKNSDRRLIIAGQPKDCENYWRQIQKVIAVSDACDQIIQKIKFIPDADVEIYFKAADVLVLPYTCIFQSGVIFLAYSFGLPVIAADVGSLKEEIIEGKTGFAFEPKNATALAQTIQNYFESNLFCELESRRCQIQDFANEKYSWNKVAAITTAVYSKLLREEENPAPFLAMEKS